MNPAPSQNLNPQESKRPSLIIGAFSNWMALGANLIVGFIITPYIILRLGTESFGIYDLALVIVGYSGLLDLGITTALVRYAARYAGQKDYGSLNRVLNTAFFGFIGMGLFIFLVFAGLSGPVAALFNVPAENRQVFQMVMSLFGLSAGLSFPGTCLSVFIIAHERFVFSNLAKILAALFRGIASYYVLWMGWGLPALAAVFVCVSFFTFVMNWALARLLIPGIRFTPRLMNFATGRELFSFGFYTFINKSGDILRFRMGQAIIKLFMGFEMVGLYGLGAMVFKNVMRITIACSGVTQPRLSSLAGKTDLTDFRKSFLHYSTIVAAFTVVMGGTAFLSAPDFLRIWLPDRIANVDIQTITIVTFILLAGFLPDLMTNVANSALQAVRKHHFLAYQTILEGIANFALAVALAWRFNNIIVVAIASAVPALVTKILVQPIYVSRITGVPWNKYLYVTLMKPLGVMIPTVVVLRVIEQMAGGALTTTNYATLLLKILVVLFILSLLTATFCLDAGYRHEIFTKLYSKWATLRFSPLFSADKTLR